MNIDRKIEIMGIVNLTDDSYYAPSRYLDVEGVTNTKALLERIEIMLGEGADIIDVGACSTRPGASLVSENEEWRRLEPALEAIWEHFPQIRLSIDTFRSSIVRQAFELRKVVQERNNAREEQAVKLIINDISAGELIINDISAGELMVNDISAGEDDPEMLATVGELGLTYIAMHKRGIPQSMQGLCEYENVTREVLEYFEEFAGKAEKAGIRGWILDPGFGFAKNIEQNYQLLDELESFKQSSRKILVGISRKSMIYKRFDITPEEALPQTQVLHYAALQRGADILRVHDVAEARRTVELYRLLA